MIRYRLICGTPSAPVPKRAKSGSGAKGAPVAGRAARTSVSTPSRRAGCGQEFESWFQNSEAFEKLLKHGQISCPACGSTSIEKALMAPNVKTTKGKERPISGIAAPVSAQAGTPSAPQRPLAMLTPEQRNFVEAMRKFREHVLSKSENVGTKFVEEARKIHYEEAEARSIHGEASLQEAKALAEEGIDVFPIPDLPDDRN